MMLKITFATEDTMAVLTWTPEYGWIAAGDRVLLEMIQYEEIEPRIVNVPVIDMPMMDGPLKVEQSDDPVLPGMNGRCFVCGCPENAHGESGCARHECKTFVP